MEIAILNKALIYLAILAYRYLVYSVYLSLVFRITPSTLTLVVRAFIIPLRLINASILNFLIAVEKFINLYFLGSNWILNLYI